MIFTLADIAATVGGTVEGDDRKSISGVAPITQAGPDEISFVANVRYAQHIATTGAGALVLTPEMACDRVPVVRHPNPHWAFAEIVDLFNPEEPLPEPGIDSSARIAQSARLDPSARIGPFCHIEEGAQIGKDCWLMSSVFVGREVVLGDNFRAYPGVKIMDGTVVGNNVTVHASTVIGSDGFGYAESDAGLKKVKQIGWVEIGDDVEIGSNVSIDRGALGPTRIGSGTKIDNLVQIAHNVDIGRNSIIVSQVGISGSTKVGSGVILAGQVGLVGHIEIGDGVRVGAQSGVSKSVPAGKTVFGYPARDIMVTKRIEASVSRLPDLFKRVKRLEKKLPD